MGSHSNIRDAGPVIRQKREAMKMSQSELSRRAGFSNRTSIGKIESGASGVSEEMLHKIAAVLGTTSDELLRRGPADTKMQLILDEAKEQGILIGAAREKEKNEHRFHEALKNMHGNGLSLEQMMLYSGGKTKAEITSALKLLGLSITTT